MKRKTIKLLTFLVSVLMLTTLMPATVFAAEHQVYNSAQLSSAINGAGTGDVITIMDSFQLSGVTIIPSGKSITIRGDEDTDVTLKSANANIRHFLVQSGAAAVFGNITLDGNNNGGGIQNEGELFLIAGATIQNCAIGFGNGGGIQNNSGKLTINGGVVIRNCDVTGRFGGGIFNNGGSVEINGGLIAGNTASNGGGLYNGISGTLKVNSGEISGNTATSGGGICNASSGILTVNGGVIIGNTATSTGGGISNAINSTTYIEGGKTENNISQNMGGGVYNNGGTVYLSSGEIKNNTATSSGGGIHNVSGTVNITGGLVSGNGARLGGGIFDTTGGAVTVSGGEISGNTATDGAGIYSSILTSSIIISDTAKISNNAATGNGGGINTTNPLIISGGVLSGNTAVSGGAVYIVNLQNVTVSTGVIFSNNKAAIARWMTNLNDIALHNEKIGDGVVFSEPPEGNAPFEYAYNNYDISYSSGNTSKPITEIRYTVRFVNWDGTVLKTESVLSGSSATAPDEPAREGCFAFIGWDADFSNITRDLTVTALYKESHNPGEHTDAQAPTCVENGFWEMRCKDCGIILESGEIAALGHDYKGEVTAPGCTEGGYTTYTCTRCGDSYKDEYIAALGHNFTVLIAHKDATPYEDGYDIFRCSRCDATKTVVIPRTALVSAVTAPKDFVSIVETAKNSRIWVLTFKATLTWSNGKTEVATYSIRLNGNNANLDGKYKFADDHDLAGYTLAYDIKGNGSNIKDFRLIS